MFVLPTTTEFGGLERHLFALIGGLDGEVQEPVITCFEHETISNYMDDDLRARTTIRCVSEPKSFEDWYRLIRSIRPDVVVFCYNWFRAFPWQAPFASLAAGVARRVSIQHLLPLPPPPVPGGKSLKDRLRRKIGRRAREMFKVRLTGHICQKTICVSNAVRDSLVWDYQFPARKTITIHNGISTSAFAPNERMRAAVRARLDVSEEDFLLVCAARLTEAKGIDILIDAVSRVNRQGVSCKCVILGEGPLKEKLEKQANSLGMSCHVLFEGFQSDVRPYFQAGSAFILTSHIEGLPLSILEAMACGLPCIVTDVGGNAEAVTDRATGFVISPGSLDEAENAILYLAMHPRECAEMATKARNTACQSFDIVTKIEELKAAIFA
jgi:glycosyltransferase involved in cell wall biosynthesis